jgi:hypothetical protein
LNYLKVRNVYIGLFCIFLMEDDQYYLLSREHAAADASFRNGRNSLTQLEPSFQSSSSPVITREYLNKISWLDEFYKRVGLSN